MISIDGSHGEGGGQVVRTALTLSAATGQSFTIKNIRGNRTKPGLLRQHLTCVEAMTEICGAKSLGAEMGSNELTFHPGDIRAGSYAFSIGTAGSTGLVFQTIMPALLLADSISHVRLKGGTHNPAAPCFDFIDQSFLTALQLIDINIERELLTYGFYPAGGGEWTAKIHPSNREEKFALLSSGKRKSITAEAIVSHLPVSIARRELAVIEDKLGVASDDLQLRHYETPGPGNAVMLRIECEHHAEIFTGFGQYGQTAERVAKRIVRAAEDYMSCEAAVSVHLADQLLVPLSLGGGGRFTMPSPTAHFETNVEIIQKFLDIDIGYEKISERKWLVEIT